MATVTITFTDTSEGAKASIDWSPALDAENLTPAQEAAIEVMSMVNDAKDTARDWFEAGIQFASTLITTCVQAERKFDELWETFGVGADD